MKKEIKVFSYLLLLLVVFGGIGLIAYFTNGFTSDFKTFYVVFDNFRIMNAEDKVLPLGNKLSFEVKSLSLDNDIEYSVKVVSKVNDETAFTYQVYYDELTYTNDLDFSSYFDVKKGDNGFSIFIPEDINMEKVLSAYYEDEVQLNTEVNIMENSYFQIIITGKGKGNEIPISFKVTSVPISEIEFTTSEVVF